MSAAEGFQAALKFCERADSRVRFKFADGEWEEATGPDFLEKLKGNDSGGVTLDWVSQVVHGENGQQ